MPSHPDSPQRLQAIGSIAASLAIFDWGVHHANGTGAADDLGSDEGRGYTVNPPFPLGSGPEICLSPLEHIPSLVESTLSTMGALGSEGEASTAAPEQLLTPRAAKQLAPCWQL